MSGIFSRRQRPVQISIMNCAFPTLFAPALHGMMTLKFWKCCPRIEGLKLNSVVERRPCRAGVSYGATPKEAIPERLPLEQVTQLPRATLPKFGASLP